MFWHAFCTLRHLCEIIAFVSTIPGSKRKKKTILCMHWLGNFYVNINKSAFVRKFEIRLLLSTNINCLECQWISMVEMVNDNEFWEAMDDMSTVSRTSLIVWLGIFYVIEWSLFYEYSNKLTWRYSVF
jgi:hypothetical protein